VILTFSIIFVEISKIWQLGFRRRGVFCFQTLLNVYCNEKMEAGSDFCCSGTVQLTLQQLAIFAAFGVV
jgi:hypothetical protein